MDSNISESLESLNKELEYLPFEFRGKTKEYFKIWIVNIALSVLTLGIYSAWAKVRTNRYIYGNTFLNNSNFEFNAEPKRILYGRLIVFSFYAIFLFATDVIYNKELALGVFTLFLLLLPWLVRQAISFRLKSASYRNIHFKYKGKTREFYKLSLLFIFALIVLFSPFIALGFLEKVLNKEFVLFLYSAFMFIFFIAIIPLFYRKLKSLIIDNSYYGKDKFNFKATKKGVIWLFFKMALLTLLASLVIGFITIVVSTMLGAYFKTLNIGSYDFVKQTLVPLGAMMLYLISIGFYKGITDGFLSNFIRNNTQIKECKFKGDIEPFTLGFISATNILATIFSLGLAYPWAKMRYLKYKTEHTYLLCDSYDKFISDGKERGSTIGEETMDFFDIDIGV